MENRYLVTLSSSDKLIATWKRKALAAGQEKMTTLVKNAILTFIEKGEFLDIGHIHFHPDNVENIKNDTILLQTARTPIISRWIEENIDAGLGISEPVKLLLSKCIRVVPDTEKEFFPPPKNNRKCNESSILRLMEENAKKITGRANSNVIIHSAIPLSQTDEPEYKSSTHSETKNSLTKESTPTIEKHSDSKESAPENNQVLTGLNSLLPKRVSKS